MPGPPCSPCALPAGRRASGDPEVRAALGLILLWIGPPTTTGPLPRGTPLPKGCWK